MANKKEFRGYFSEFNDFFRDMLTIFSSEYKYKENFEKISNILIKFYKPKKTDTPNKKLLEFLKKQIKIIWFNYWHDKYLNIINNEKSDVSQERISIFYEFLKYNEFEDDFYVGFKLDLHNTYCNLSLSSEIEIVWTVNNFLYLIIELNGLN